VFVSSASTVDRLQALRRGSDTWVSNSLACLLAGSGTALDLTYNRYPKDFRTVIRGVNRYRRSIPTADQPVQLVYYDNLVWDGVRLSQRPKPNPRRDFTSFEAYRGFVEGALRGLAANMRAPERTTALRFLGTVSTGYDSATAAALTQPFGLRDAITFTEARSGESDSGAAVAHAMGVTLQSFSRDAWQTMAPAEFGPPAPEVLFLASDGKGEDVFFRAAEPLLRGRVLVTGFHGDKMWDIATRALGPEIVRGDQSGLSLTEYRLWAGFIHCPVAFLGVRQIADVHALGLSAEMTAWDVGGDYTRPICRRVVEQAGVPRLAFGQTKKAASVHFYYHGNFLSTDSTKAFLGWLADQQIAGSLELGQRTKVQRIAGWLSRVLGVVAAHVPAPFNVLRRAAGRFETIAARERLFAHVFAWAIGQVAACYQRGLQEVTRRTTKTWNALPVLIGATGEPPVGAVGVTPAKGTLTDPPL